MDDNNMPQIKSLSNLPLSFEANIGQKDNLVKFLTRGKGYTAFFTPTEVVLTLVQDKAEDRPINKREDSMNHNKKELLEKQSIEYSILKMKMEGANPDTEIIGEEKLEGKINYFIGNDPEKWVTDVPTYEKVRYQEIYPGIDLLYYGKSRQLEHDFIVKPGSDPRKINLSFEGAEKIEIDDEGNLLIQAKKGELKLLKPIVYQHFNGTQQEIESFYEIRETGTVGFLLGEYDRDVTLKIDPVLVYSTFLGGSASEEGKGIAVDAAGNAYAIGYTYSSDFPTTAGTYDTIPNGVDAFVTKLNVSGTGLIYSTFLGGSDYEEGRGIAVDTAGNAYVTGITNSSDFPTTAGAYDTISNGGQYKSFVTELNASGTGLNYSTFLGGGNVVEAKGISVDEAGNAYVTGVTNSSDFPTTEGAYDTTFNGGDYDAFVTKLNESGTELIYSTFLGGGGYDWGNGIAVDAAGNAYVTGETQSSDFPTTLGAYDTTFTGTADAFVTKLNASGTELIYSTFLGGGDYEEGRGIAVEEAGNAYVTGYTYSSDFPTTAGAYDTTYNGNGDVFLTKLNDSGTGLIYSTFLGGSDFEWGNGIAVDTAGNVYVTGLTDSSNFSTTAWAYDITYNGDGDAFVTKFSFALSVPNYNITTLVNTSVIGAVVGTDYSGFPLTYSLLTDASHGTVIVNSDGTWIYTPDENYYGAGSFTILVDNGHGGIAISTINIDVSFTNVVVQGSVFVTSVGKINRRIKLVSYPLSIIEGKNYYYWHAPNVKLVNNKCACNSNKIILNCGKPLLSTIPFHWYRELPVSKITVDTSRLQDQEIKLDIVISIAIPAGVTIANLTFQVFKLCKDMYQKMPVGPQWSYKKSFVFEANDIITFFVYDNDTFESKCCTYIVEATSYS